MRTPIRRQGLTIATFEAAIFAAVALVLVVRGDPGLAAAFALTGALSIGVYVLIANALIRTGRRVDRKNR